MFYATVLNYLGEKMCVCVCVREREGRRGREIEGERGNRREAGRESEKKSWENVFIIDVFGGKAYGSSLYHSCNSSVA